MKNIYLILFSLLVFYGTAQALENPPPAQNSELLRRMQKETPYSLEQTAQTFTKTVHGGVEHVVVKTPGNTAQIKLIQSHLQKLADQYRKGDFSVSERIHGPKMPGLVVLKTAKEDDIRFEYRALENGGQIHYASEYPQFVEALHEWFAAQTSDPTSTEIPGHAQHHATPAE
ncbi:MAG: aspartate carbamoyltransferase [Methylomonas sp.]|jgi:hypothetical protein